MLYRLSSAYSGGYQSSLPGPPEVVAGSPAATVNFKLHTQCLSREVKIANPNFWYSGIEGGYVVKHNYQSDDFFNSANAIPMNRGQIGDGEYGYTLTTDQVDWEWGFALKNNDGQWYYDIGVAGATTPLAGQSCTQMYWPYFNRVIVAEGTRDNVEYIFSECVETCPPDYFDSAYCALDLTPQFDGTRLDLGESDDARLVSFSSALMIDPVTDTLYFPGRTVAYRDTKFAETADEARWIIAMMDLNPNGGSGPNGGVDTIKMVTFRVVRDPSDGHAYAVGQTNRDYRFPNGNCDKVDCYVGKHDVVSLESQATDVGQNDYKIDRLEYVSMMIGDTPPKQFSTNFVATQGRYLTSAAAGYPILQPEELGMDEDVRKVILTFAAVCGVAINYDHCLPGKAIIDRDFAPTSTEKRWIIAAVDGRSSVYFKMVKVSVFIAGDQSVRMRAVEAGYVSTTLDGNNFDTYDSLYQDVPDAWARRNQMSANDGYNIGAIDFQVAAAMSMSLVSNEGCGA